MLLCFSETQRGGGGYSLTIKLMWIRNAGMNPPPLIIILFLFFVNPNLTVLLNVTQLFYNCFIAVLCLLVLAFNTYPVHGNVS